MSRAPVGEAWTFGPAYGRGSRLGAPCEYDLAIPSGDGHGDHPRMKRITLSTLWFFAGWVIGAMTAFVLGLPDLIAPITAVMAALAAYRPVWLSRVGHPSPQSVSGRAS